MKLAKIKQEVKETTQEVLSVVKKNAAKLKGSKNIASIIEKALDNLALRLVDDLTIEEVAEILEKKLEKNDRLEDSITIKKIKVKKGVI